MANRTSFEESDFDGSAYDADSDDESLINVDSPADGYFTQRDIPRETFVENPRRVSEDKEREAAEERQRQLSRPSHTTTAAQSAAPSRQSAGFDESAPLFDAGPAPPDYYQATAGRRDVPRPYSQGHTRGTSYGSISSPPPSRGQGQSRHGVDNGQTQSLHNAASFSSDHPLVRNGLFDEQGTLNSSGQHPQTGRSPSDPSPPQQLPLQSSQSNASPQETSNPEETNRPSTRQRDEESGTYQNPHFHHHHHQHQHDYYPYQKRKSRWRRFCYCLPRMSCFNFFLILALILMFILLTSTGSDDGFGDNPHSKLPIDDSQPDKKIPIPTHPDNRQCKFSSSSMYKSFDFVDPGNFSFLEMIDSSQYSHIAPSGARLSGTVRIARLDDAGDESITSEDVSIRVWVHAAATEPWIIKDLAATKDDDGFELGFPDVHLREVGDGEIWEGFHVQEYVRPCLDFAVLIQIRKGVELQNWDLSTANLDVQVENGVFTDDDPWADYLQDHEKTQERLQNEKDGLKITHDTTMYAVKGSIDAAYWSSRRTRIATVSSPISGTYALHDCLELETVSGDINVGVDPKKAASDDPDDLPADLIVKSKSGVVNVEFPMRHGEYEGVVAKRQYRARVATISSDILGRYLLGTEAIFSTDSGKIDAIVLPYTSNVWNSTLRTTSRSGKTKLNLLSSLTAKPFATGSGSIDPNPPHLSRWNMGSIQSVHKSTSGKIQLTYPWRWAGIVDAKTETGSMKVHGEEVKIIDDVHGPGFERIFAKKGLGASLMKVKTTSGDVHVLVGDEEDEDSN